MAGQATAAVRSALTWARLIGVEPDAAPPSVIALLALTPPVVAGLLLFRLDALEVLAIALGAGLAAQVAARLLDQPLDGTPLLPALIGVAMIGSGAALPWAAAVAVAAAAFELARARFVPAARLQVGLVAYALVLLASRGGPAVAASPAGAHSSVDPVGLYVGDVAGPVFATSMLAVALGAAWLWYSRRLSLLVLLTFLAGAAVPIVLERLPAGYELVSGPLWFAVALVLADRRTLPSSALGRPLLGLVTGLVALGARARGLAVEAVPVAVAGMQVVTVSLQGLDWMRRHREETRARLRELREAMAALRLPGPGAAQPPS